MLCKTLPMPNDIYTYITHINVSLDETVRMDCPICNGHNTFTVTNEMGFLLYNCYKASCDVSGKHKVRLSAEDIQSKVTKKEAEKTLPYEGTDLPSHVVSYEGRDDVIEWCKRWDLDPKKIDIHYDVKEERVVFPIKHDGRIVDGVGRSLKNLLPKWKRYGQTRLPFTFGSGKVAVVVEDCVSASVIGSDMYLGVAVLGTSLSEEHKKYLARFSTAIIALDPDAIPKTMQFARELRTFVKDVKVLKLKDDLKYFNTEDIINLYSLTPKEKSEWSCH
tara:strand:+ start:82 stop:909 length:828 start_codon:yes stop_codon:yes gene_type:complete